MDAIERLVSQLRPAARIGWSRPANLHITTKFIGEWPEERLAELQSALATIGRPGVIEIAVSGIGWFPNPHHPKVLFAAAEAGDSLKELAAATDRTTAELGVPAENRAYSPHLTLARIRTPVDLRSLRQRIAEMPSQEFGCIQADRFYLYLSELHPAGSVYHKLAEFPLR